MGSDQADQFGADVAAGADEADGVFGRGIHIDASPFPPSFPRKRESILIFTHQEQNGFQLLWE